MLSCKEVATILSTGEPRGGMRRFHLRFHLMMCQHCRRFERQLKALATGLRDHVDRTVESSEARLSGLVQEIVQRESRD